MKFGNKVPYEYFITSGKGESDLGIHTGSFDQALVDAGIGNQNIVFYTSILPPTAKKVRKKKLKPGCVLDAIMAISNGKKGERITAGIGVGWVFKGNKKVIGLVAEYEGHESKSKCLLWLKKSLKEMFSSRFDSRYKLKIETRVESFIPKKKYGTVLVAICFVSYKNQFIFE